MATCEAEFRNAVAEKLSHEEKAANDRRQANLSSLTEEIRQLLIEAAYIELALAANRDLFDEPLPLDFSEQAYQRLKRHKVPFSGAIKLVGQGLPRPRSDDAMFLRYRESQRESLSRRFDAVRTRITDRLKDLVGANVVTENPVTSVGDSVDVAVSSY